VHVNYFNVSFDMDVQIAGAKLVRKILNTPPLRYVGRHSKQTLTAR